MKKCFMILFLTFLIVLTLPSHVYAEDTTSEVISYTKLAVDTAKANGEMTEGQLIKYTLKYGRVEGEISTFTNITVNTELNEAQLGLESGDAHANHWKVFTQNNQGIIYVVEAKTDVEISFKKSNNQLGWIGDANLNVYVESAGVKTKVVTKALTGSSTAQDLEAKVTLAAGEIAYYEYYFEWTPHRNMEFPPTIEVLKAGELIPVDVNQDGVINAQGVHFNTATAADGIFKSYTLANYGVLFGKDLANLSKFDVVEVNNTTKETQLGSNTSDAFIKDNEINLNSNQDVVYQIDAKDDLSIEFTSPKIEGDFTNLTIDFKKKTGEVIENIESINLSVDQALNQKVVIDKDSTLFIVIKTNEETNQKLTTNFSFKFKLFTGEVPPAYDFTERTTVTLTELVDQAVRLSGEESILKDGQINVLQGKLTSQLNKFKYYTYVPQSESYELTTEEFVFAGKTGAAVQTWRIKTTLDSHVVVRFTANKDLELDITHGATSSGWIDNKGEFIGLYIMNQGVIYPLHVKDLTSNQNAANSLGGKIQLKNGDTAFWVFGSNSSEEANLEIIPTWTTDYTKFDANTYDAQFNVSKETVNMWDALTGVINNNYNDKSYIHANIGFYIGDAFSKDLSKFNYHEGDGTGTYLDALWNGSSKEAGYQRWQMQAAFGQSVSIKLEAKADLYVDIKHTAVWPDAWSKHTGVRYLVMDEEGTIMILKEILVENDTPNDHFGNKVYLRENEVLFIEYYTVNTNWGSLNFAPEFNFDTELFDESKATDFSYIKELDLLKEEKVSDLNAFVDALNEAEYKLSNWSKIQELLEEAITKLKTINTKEEVNQLYGETIKSIEAVQTIDEQNAEINAYKETKAKELEDYVKALGSTNYSNDNWNKINDLVAKFKKDIEALTQKAQIDVQFAKTKAEIDKVELKESNNLGTILTVVSILALSAALTGVIFIVKKRK